jgi:hypothetical protein
VTAPTFKPSSGGTSPENKIDMNHIHQMFAQPPNPGNSPGSGQHKSQRGADLQQVVDQAELAKQRMWFKAMDERIKFAIEAKQKVRFEDLLVETYDKTLPQPSQDEQEQIKLLCNQVGRGNFDQKLMELKALINDATALPPQEQDQEASPEQEPQDQPEE